MSDHDKTLAERGENEKTMAGHTRHDDHLSGGHKGGPDQAHDDHGVGGHEVDKMPSGRLFNLLFGLSALTLVACIGVVQLFYRQVDSIRDVRDTKQSFQLAEYRQEMDDVKGGRVLEMTDDDGVPGAEGGRGVFETKRYQMPLAEARKRVLEQPQQLLKAGRPYRGWRNPDANAPKAIAPAKPRTPARPVPRPGVDGQPAAPGGMVPVVPVQPGNPGGMVMPVPTPGQPGAPAEGKAPAPAEREGKAPAPAPAKREGKAEGKAPAPAEGKAVEGKAP
jgi:hypothetical protein